MNFLIYLISGMTGAFCSSAPIGPINLWVMGTSSHSSKNYLRRFVAGVVFVDVFFAGIALWGYGEVFSHSNFNFFWQVAGTIVMLLFGFSLLKSSKAIPVNKNDNIKPQSDLKPFLTGALLCASNPGFLAFWLAASSSILSMVSASPTPSLIGLFLLGVVVGDVLWFFSLSRLLRWTKSHSFKIDMKALQTFAAFLILIVGVLGLVRMGLKAL